MANEADTCRRFVVPKLQSAGWDNEPHQIREQLSFTDGRIVVVGGKGIRRPAKRRASRTQSLRLLAPDPHGRSQRRHA